MTTSSVGFFNPIYSRENNFSESECEGWLGRIVEPLFDFGQTSYTILPGSFSSASIPVIKKEAKKGLKELVKRILKAVILIFATLSVVGMAAILCAKYYYRQVNKFEVQLLSLEDLAKINDEMEEYVQGSIDKQTKFDKFTDKIDGFTFEEKDDFSNCVKLNCKLSNLSSELGQKLNRVSIFFGPDEGSKITNALANIDLLRAKLKNKLSAYSQKIISEIEQFRANFEIQSSDKYLEALSFAEKEALTLEMIVKSEEIEQFLTDFGTLSEFEAEGLKKVDRGWQLAGRPVINSDKLKQLNEMAMPKAIGNLGTSCYLNASLQLLFSSPVLRESIASDEWPGFNRIFDDLLEAAHEQQIYEFDGLIDTFKEKWPEVSEEDWECYLQILKTPIGNPFDDDEVEGGLSIDAANLLDLYARDFRCLMKIQGSLQECLKEYEKPGSTARSLSLKVYHLRAALFKAGLITNGLYEQQDAAEMLNYFLTTLGFIVPISTQRNFLKGDSKVYSDKQTDPYSNIAIPIPDQENAVSIQALLDNFFEEQSSGSIDDPWTFEGNEEVEPQILTEYNEKLQLEGEPPQFICLSLNRFNNAGDKIKTKISWAEDFTIDLSKAFGLDKECPYTLKAAVHQSGKEAAYGHYTTALNKDNIYFNCNDESISKQKENQFTQKIGTAYFFLLERKQLQ